MRKTNFAVVLFLLSGAGRFLHAGPVGIAVTSPGTVGSIDVSTGSFHALGCVPAGCSTPGPGGGIGRGPGGALDVYDLATRNLYQFDSSAGASLVGNTGAAFSVFAGLGDGRLYGIDFSGDLYRVDASNGAVSLVSHVLDFSPDGFVSTSLAGDGSSLFFTYDAAPFAIAPFDSTLFRIDPDTGATTTVGLTGIERIGGSGYLGGALYGFTFSVEDDGSGGFLLGSENTFLLDTSTGAASLVAPYDALGQPIFGAVDTPEPAALGLAGLAVLVLGLRSRSR